MVTRKQQGFTIIEVVLVLAIAGLIFLMVFLALPALQKSQRDTVRRNSLSTFSSQVTQFQSNNKGAVPTTAAIDTFVTKYMQSNWTDPVTNVPYVQGADDAAVDLAASIAGTWYYTAGRICNGEAITATGAGARNFAVRMKLEGSGVACQDNK